VSEHAQTPTEPERLTIGEVSRRSGVKATTVRYYESLGVLPEPERLSGQRRYTVDVLRRLAIVDVAQRAGFSLEEIAELFAAADAPAFEQLRALAERKLPAIEHLITRAQAVHRWLEVASACECQTLDVCGLFDDSALGLRDQQRWPAGRAALQVIPPA
jgi:MerR family transcriptional regulator, redox-sensitive transcriptional activator SoxR